MAKEITQFQGEWRWLSNFGPGEVTLGKLTFPRREHGYQASKSLNLEVRKGFTDPAMTAGQAKRAGGFIEIRPDWERVKKKIMLLVVLSAFTQNLDLQKLLTETEDAYLEEGNTWHDNFWGACGCPRHLGAGENWLGRILTMVRDIVRED